MAEWNKFIHHCFGSNDVLFARHPSDLENARNLIQTAHKEGAAESIVSQELKNYMISRKMSSEHIGKELEWFHHGWAWLT